MGIMNYYLDFTFDKARQDEIKNIYEERYIDFFSLCFAESEIQNKIEVSIESCFENFLIANYAIFDFVEELKRENEIISFSINKEIENWNFDEKSDFIYFVYKKYEEKISHFYSTFGTFVINPHKYWKTFQKLHKKYYRKYNFKARKTRKDTMS